MYPYNVPYTVSLCQVCDLLTKVFMSYQVQITNELGALKVLGIAFYVYSCSNSDILPSPVIAVS